MKMTMMNIATTWICATGVAVVATCNVLTRCSSSARAEKHAARISRRGTIPEYKSANRHSSAVRKTTAARAEVKEIKVPTYVANPLRPFFMDALDRLTGDVAELAKDGDVSLRNGFVLTAKDGRPTLKFPKAYGKVVIGGVAMGDELKNADFLAHRTGADGTDQCRVGEVFVRKHRRLGEPEFYCTSVTYAALPATRQVDRIRMHGDLVVRSTSKANAMVKEISKWMKEDFGAVDLRVAPQAGTLALKKFRIGAGMDVEVAVNWKNHRTDDGTDARIDISFTTSELVEDGKAQRQELGQATDEARVNLLCNTGVNYFTVNPNVRTDAVNRKVVY